jgi:hypothetical protein
MTMPKVIPIARIHRHLTSPLPQKRIAGNAANKNRNAEKKIGGNDPSPILMTTKLNPHIKATNIARKISLILICSPYLYAPFFTILMIKSIIVNSERNAPRMDRIIVIRISVQTIICIVASLSFLQNTLEPQFPSFCYSFEAIYGAGQGQNWFFHMGIHHIENKNQPPSFDSMA